MTVRLFKLNRGQIAVFQLFALDIVGITGLNSRFSSLETPIKSGLIYLFLCRFVRVLSEFSGLFRKSFFDDGQEPVYLLLALVQLSVSGLDDAKQPGVAAVRSLEGRAVVICLDVVSCC